MLLKANQEVYSKRTVIELIEQHLSYKRLMEHHDVREKSFLYPLLDSVLSLDDKTSLLKKCFIMN